jgi:C4-dicarboxylate transporter DctM subunit
MILSLMVGALIFSYGITIMGIPQAITSWVGSLQVSPLVVLILINFLLIFMGIFLEVSSIILITLPILYPLVLALNFDPIWFGVIMILNMEMAVITPPVGMNLYVMKGIASDLSIGDIISGSLPFVIVEAITIALVIAFPSLATWLPSMVK